MYSVKSSFFNPHSFKVSNGFKDYSFITSKTKQQLNKLLTKNDYQRLLSLDLNEIYKILNDKGYSLQSNDSVDLNIKKIESSFKDEIKSLLKGIEQLSPSNVNKTHLEEFLLGTYDFNNLKILYKGLSKDLSFEKLPILGTGYLSIGDLNKIYQDKSIGFLPSFIKEAMGDYKKKGIINNPKQIDITWDFLLHRFYKQKMEVLSRQFISHFYTLQVDTKNILTMFRLKSIKEDFNVFKSSFMSHGSITLMDFKNMYLQSIEELKESFKALPYDVVIQRAIENYMANNSFSDLEKCLEEHILSCVIRAKKLLEGPDIIVAYFFLKQTELSNISILFTSLVNKIDPQWALTKMRLIYV